MRGTEQTRSSTPGGCHVRRRPPKALSALAVLLALVCGCEQEPTPLFFGEWIDVYGHDRSADEVCGGTFEYLDSYAGALAVEFGVSEHLGEYHWYTHAQHDENSPCADVYACSYDDQTLHTPLLPHEHEIVHLANFAAGICPKVLSEGLAEYYSTIGRDAEGNDFPLLVSSMDDPSMQPPAAGFGILGRFAAYLVAHFGIDAVLEVCRATGRYPDGAELSAALVSVLGQTREELLADFELDLDFSSYCNESRVYQSRVYACGAAEAAPYAGLVDDEGLELKFTLDCANDRTIGPLGDRIWIVERIDLPADATYLLWMEGEDVEIPEVSLTLASCEPCGRAGSSIGEFVGPEQHTAGPHWLEVSAPADFRGTVTVGISR